MFRGFSDNLDAALSDPERDGKFAIADARGEIQAFEHKVRDLAAQTIILRNRRDESLEDIKKYTNIASSAAAAGNEDDVRLALLEKARAQRTVAELEEDITANDAAQKKASDHMLTMRQKIDEAEMAAQRDSVRLQTGNLRTALADETSALGQGFAEIGKLKTSADQAEAIAQATEDMAANTPEARKAAFEAKYSEGHKSVDDEVRAMMAAASATQGTM